MYIDTSPEVLQAMIKYCYTDTLPEVSSDSDDVLEFDWAGLHAMGDKYDIQPLADDVERAMLWKLNKNTAMKILKIAFSIKNNDRLFRQVSAFIQNKAPAIMENLYGIPNDTLALLQDAVNTSTFLFCDFIVVCCVLFYYHVLGLPLLLLSSYSPPTTVSIPYCRIAVCFPFTSLFSS